uniref:R3H domain-containing protein n=1 Tax=Aegilops tauschii subsp. strangulata TaxID=200361 RepID=A0A453E1L9_AEGTS
MDNTQFAMIEELASLIKDNLYSKHLVLSTEEALVTLLQQRYHDDDDEEEHDRAATGARHGPAGNTIELQPTSSYNRLLLHRLADIYGFAHESVGEGEDRHLVLQRCPETAIPPVLVSDVLWNYDDSDGPSASLMLARNETGESFFMCLLFYHVMTRQKLV